MFKRKNPEILDQSYSVHLFMYTSLHSTLRSFRLTQQSEGNKYQNYVCMCRFLSSPPQPYFAFLCFLLCFQGLQTHELCFTGFLVIWVPVRIFQQTVQIEMKRQGERRSRFFFFPVIFVLESGILQVTEPPAVKLFARICGRKTQ